MKLNEIVEPKKEEYCDELPMFLRPQAGPKLTARDRKRIAKRIESGKKPAFLKKQAE